MKLHTIKEGKVNSMEKVEFLPLGSIVVVRGGIKKIMIIARGLAVEIQGSTKVFDYAGCLYPEGLMGDQILQFNHTEIIKTVFKGFSDEDELLMLSKLNDWLENSPFERGNAMEINQQKQADAAAQLSAAQP